MELLYQQYVRFYERWSIDNAEKGIGEYIELLSRVINRLFNLALTQFYLRKAAKGKGVVCVSKPTLAINGHLEIGNNVRIWSSIEKTRISVFKKGELRIGSGSYING
ncbi:MAG TPA: hypothetical protein VG603_03620, partial [Chitinophagales bacterium]|nr:hypothetical protein [Chitinophagales bacterium]